MQNLRKKITLLTISLNCRKNVYFWKYMYIFPRTFSLGVSNMLSKSTPNILRNGKKNLLKVISEYHMHLCKLPNWIVWTENMTFEILQNAMDKVKILIESCWVVIFGSKVIFKLTCTLTWRILPISIGNCVIFKK